MQYMEAVILVLVVIHAAQHLPHELKQGWDSVQKMLTRYLGDGPYPNGLRLAVAVAMALVTAVSFSPLVYYGLECGVRLYAPHAATA